MPGSWPVRLRRQGSFVSAAILAPARLPLCGALHGKHYDLYRLSDPDELLDIGFEEETESGISLIEWPEGFEELMPPDAVRVTISRGGEDCQRIIEVSQ